MNIKNNELSYEEKYSMLNDRVREIKGDLVTLDFRMEIDKIDARLYRMKRKTFMYELELINDEVGQLMHNKSINELMNNLNLKEV